MAKKTKLIKFKDKCWEWRSKYCRLLYSNEYGNVKCFTCDKVGYWEKDGIQAGHYSDSRCNILLLKGLIRPQCSGCNLFKSGNKNQYTFNLLNEGFTIEQLKKEENLKHQVLKMKWQDWEEEYLNFKKLAELEAKKRGLVI